jgi:vanillate monooxygenase ferredoxin subunit
VEDIQMEQQLLQVKVAARMPLAEGIAAYALAPLDGSVLPGFEAGAHIDVHVPGGFIRQYSLYELPGEHRQYRISVLRDPQSRGGSASLLETVQEGDTLTISAPRNHFALQPRAGHSLLFAGGIGITPILCMAQQLACDGREFALHYCGRSLAKMAFVDRLRDAPYAQRVRVHVDDGAPAQQLDARVAIGTPAADRHLYVCGPTGFMDHILVTARTLGWDEAHLHREYFAAAPIDHSADGPFELEIRSSGRRIRVAAQQSAAQALLDAGVAVTLSCEQGVCGTCLTKVADGVPDHRDLYLTDEEHGRNDCFMPCCSRSRTPRLVLDL